MNDKSHLLRFGYAPGNYWFVCRDCGNKHAVGDKRAIRCETCAESLHAQITSVEAVADKHRAMTTIPEETQFDPNCPFDAIAETTRQSVGMVVFNAFTSDQSSEMPTIERRRAIMAGALTGVIGTYLVMFEGTPESDLLQVLTLDINQALANALVIVRQNDEGEAVQ